MQQTLLNIYKNNSDDELVSLIKSNGDNLAFIEVCDRYEDIFYKVCQKYTNVLVNSGINVQDIFDEKNFIIFHCILTFNPTKKAKLSTWIGNFARYLCLNSINSRKFILPTINEDSIKKICENKSSQDYNDSSLFEENNQYINNIISQFRDKRMEEVFRLRYGDKKMIWSKIAKKMDISMQTAINFHRKGISLIKKKIKSNSTCDII